MYLDSTMLDIIMYVKQDQNTEEDFHFCIQPYQTRPNLMP